MGNIVTPRRISVTDLDSFLYWRNEEEATLEDLLQRLRHEDAPSSAMLAGRALHSFLELARADPAPRSIDVIETKEHRFLINCDIDLALPEVRELKGEMHIGPVTLVGVIDGLEGLSARDYKLTSSTFDATRYIDSYQWRCYLAMFGLSQFDYEVFVGKETGQSIGPPRRSIWTITEHHHLRVHAYPALMDDVVRLVNEFNEFLDSINFVAPVRTA